MNAPERIKLQAAGTSLVMRVQSASQVPVGTYPEYAFVGVSVGGQGPKAVELRVPKASADRQLGRMWMKLEDTIGKMLLFSRDENKQDAKKPYWSIVLASGAAKGTGGASNDATGVIAQPTPTAQPAAPKEEKPSGAALYRKIAKWYLDEILPLYIDAGVPVTHEGCGAGIACLYIQANSQHR